MVLPERKRHLGYQVGTSHASPVAGQIAPRCPHFGVCGGCTLQNLDPAEQIRGKQESLRETFASLDRLTPEHWFEPLTGPVWNYRRKARLSARYVFKKERVLVGFRERAGRYVADLSECHILDPRIAGRLPQLSRLVASLETYRRIPQLEVACGDEQASLVFRHLDPLPEGDLERLREYAQESGIAVFLQPAGPDSIHPLDNRAIDLSYSLPDHDVVIHFQPADFIQVNGEMNRLMVDRAIELLDPRPGERVLDLFCGLGNFTLPMARRGAQLTGIEGDPALVERARENASRNGIGNAAYHHADLKLEAGQSPWLQSPYEKVLIDPPRSGAGEMLRHIAASGAWRVLYISCHPQSLAEDAAVLVRAHDFRLRGAGVIDMFPHTGHVESIALFER